MPNSGTGSDSDWSTEVDPNHAWFGRRNVHHNECILRADLTRMSGRGCCEPEQEHHPDGERIPHHKLTR